MGRGGRHRGDVLLAHGLTTAGDEVPEGDDREAGGKGAEEERARAEERADAERAIAERMAAEMDRMRREIEALRGGGG